MIVDLSSQAGFPLQLDPGIPDVSVSGDIRFQRQDRLVAEMQPVLLEPDALPSELPLYWNYRLLDAGASDGLYREMRLTFGLVLLPGLKVGCEFVKSHGHYHSSIPGSQIGHPEVYTHYYGELYLYMQRRCPGSSLDLDDCVVYRMVPGQSIMIPPGYAHIVINPSREPALMGGLYSLQSLHEYASILATRGGAYFLVEEDGHEKYIPNPCYSQVPLLREITLLAGTPFEPPEQGEPLWRSFAEHPERYIFINDALASARLFHLEDYLQ